jgi:thioredoxin-related protein
MIVITSLKASFDGQGGLDRELLMKIQIPLVRMFLVCLVIATSLTLRAERAPILDIGAFEIPPWFKSSFLDLTEDVVEAMEEDRRLIIMFHQEGCPYCAKLVNYNFSQKPIVDYLRGHFDILELNMWGSREVTDFDGETLTEAQLAKKWKVWFTPTLLFFDEQGKVIFRMNGYYSPDRFLTVLKYVAEKQERVMPFYTYTEKQNPSKTSGTLTPEPFFAPPPYRLSAHRPTVVFFEQRDCGECDALHAGPLNDPDTRKQLQGLHAIQLDRWSRTPVVMPDGEQTSARHWANSLKISYLPAVVFFDDGHEVIRAEALFKSFHLQSMAEYVTSDAYRTETEFQRYVQKRAEELRERGIIVDLWK